MSAGFRSLLAVLESGFESGGIVMGAAGFQLVRPSSCMTFGTGREPVLYPYYEDSVRNAWRTAIDRLEAETASIGAHGVVGVSISNQSDPSNSVTQLSLLGTAVRVPGAEPLSRPFLSMLSMDDTLKLLLRGWVPCGVGVGFSAIHVHGYAASPMWQGNLTTNAEMEVLTDGVQIARGRAEENLRESLGPLQAAGAIASTLTLQRFGQSCGKGQGVLIEGQMLGTAVVQYREPAVSVSAVRSVTRGRSS